jgi:polyisoprenyl-teichoic acid--peptidoglycan teichoic acid transferase
MEIYKKRRILTKTQKWITVGITAVILILVGWGCVTGVQFMYQTGLTPGLAIQLLLNDGITLKSSDNKTNILLLGIGGGTHEGGDLTDTMIVLSLDNANKSAALISIPRDIWSDTLKAKVNSAYHYGELKQKGGGMILSKVVAEDVIGMPIQYSLLIDFSGFKDIVDLLGGIDVNVSAAFTDNDYPIPGKEHDTCPDDPTNRCVYETVHFDSGLQHMDGSRALIYVRSRHAEGEEGSDFARNRRQQEVLIALKDKIIHPLSWVTPGRLSGLPHVIDQATDTDMNMGELASVFKQYIRIKDGNVAKVSFDTMLTEAPSYLYNGLYVLVPVDSWDTIQTFIKNQLK